jgi:hypothetical protein
MTTTPADLIAALNKAAADLYSGYPGHGYSIEYVNGFEDAAAFAEGYAAEAEQNREMRQSMNEDGEP